MGIHRLRTLPISGPWCRPALAVHRRARLDGAQVGAVGLAVTVRELWDWR
ncbi:hypothetical protein [Frankia sp. R82]|nr:hypothetical protein [Frankia sp. R82]MCM3887043.1 hypothetical protein [Frankia sp. R82]